MDNPTGADLDNLMEELETATAEEPQADAGAKEAISLTPDEMDLLGEIGNICMGTAATTLSTLLGKKVNITTPKVSIAYNVEDLGHYAKPFLAVEVSYTEGVDGYNILLMQEHDVKIITDLLMGGEGIANDEEEIDELHFSAISEVMNQMVGSSSTSLSNLINKRVDITPPKVKKIVMEDDDLSTLVCHNDTIIKISFDMEIEGVLQSELMQLLPYDFGKQMAHDMMFPEEEAPAPAPAPAAPAAPIAAPQPQAAAPVAPPPMQAAQPQAMPAQPMYQQPQPAPMPMYQQPQAAPMYQQPAPQVEVTSVQYNTFEDAQMQAIQGAENIGLILDVPLQITVELGQCKRSIKDILGFSMGSVIVLDRLAGEMVDIMVNGKLFARGEVVVIDDNYGVRVTDIVAVPQV